MSAVTLRGVQVKEEPHSASNVCFVCGSSGGEYLVHSKPQERNPYFPFLDNHHPPIRAERPNADGSIISCAVCYSFLLQQWDAFERTRTPHNKRLYWLKRTDNGPFAGMEVGVQDEFASQYLGMGSQNHSGDDYPSGESRKRSVLNFEADSAHSFSQDVPDSSSNDPVTRSLPKHLTPEPSNSATDDNGALDLSVTSRASSRSSVVPSPITNSEACYVCGEDSPKFSLVNIYTTPIANCPFFPSLLNHPKPEKARPMDSSGRVFACESCHRHLLQQWDSYKRKNIPHTERSYHLRHSLKGGVEEFTFVCFTCGLEYPSVIQRIVSSRLGSDVYFSFLEHTHPPPGSTAIDSHGKVAVCSICYKSLLRQLQVFELSGIPEEKRKYKLPSDVLPQTSSGRISRHLNESVSKDVCIFNCYICNKQLTADQSSVLLHTTIQNSEPYFPFLCELNKLANSKPIDQLGRVLVCSQCSTHLYSQWESFEINNIPFSQRRYAIAVQPAKRSDTQSNSSSSALARKSMNSLLHIQVSSPDVHIEGNRQLTNIEPLLTTVPTLVTNSCITSQSHYPATISHNIRLSDVTVASATARINSLRVSLDDPQGQTQLSSNSLRIYSPSEQFPTLPPLLIAAVCFVCGEYSSPGNTYSVHTHSKGSLKKDDNHEVEQNSFPFFPFLTRHTPPSGAEQPVDGNNVLVCMFCYFSLMAQWLAYETSPHPEDSNRWLRKYNIQHYVCYICGITTYRKRVRCITVQDFPFLVEHPQPPGALTLKSGESVVTCLTCFDTLTSQWKDYERMKVPVEMRKYNWITLPPPPQPAADENRSSQNSVSIFQF